MTQAIIRRETFPFQTPGVVTGGTAVYTLPTNDAAHADQIMRVKAVVFITGAAAAHLVNGCALLCECIVINKNGTVTFNTALATSVNPENSNTAGFELTSRPETADGPVGTSTAIWTIVGNVLTLTVTNSAAAGGVTADITAILDVDRTGST